MCIVSNVGDGWRDNFPDKYPWYPTQPEPFTPSPANPTPIIVNPVPDLSKFATKEDIEKLRQEMIELKKLLQAAIEFDKKTGQPNCEMEDKIALIKQVAEAVGVDLSDLGLGEG